VDDPARPGEWGILKQEGGTEHLIGVYPWNHDAMRIAWKYSLINSTSRVVVKYLSGVHPGEVYRFTAGAAENY